MSSVDLKNLSMKELQKLVKKEYKENKKLRENNKKDKLMEVYQKLVKQNNKLKQEKPKIKSKPNIKPKTKSCDDYFRECIKNQTIPKDTPPYLKKALERALKEYNVGIKREKSALDNFAEKYAIDGKPDIFPIDFFKEKVPQIKKNLKDLRNIKVRFLMTFYDGTSSY